MAEFLLEIGLEEIPARMIATAEAELGRRVSDLLVRERLLATDGKVTTYSTPRRLAVRVEGVAATQADTKEQLVGPSWKIAFKDGVAGPAAEAFAKKAGVDVAALEKITNAKGEYVGATVERKGRRAAELLADELPKEVLAIYWAKNMYWRANKPERFVRPVRWLIALLDATVLPLEIAGIRAGNVSRGHRILFGEKPVVVANAAAYESALRAAFVLVDVAARRETIRKALDAATRTVAGARWREDEGLVETVVHLTEWPTVLLGNFETEYLSLPEEVLVTVMRDHQKYFAVESADGKLAPHFLTVLNTEVDAEGEAIIRHGNARVLRARFKDAQFFWDADQKTSLVERVESLKSVTFQKDLGSYFWKTEEVVKFTNILINQMSPVTTINGYIPPDCNALSDAVRLSKTDLTTELVKEFTELQGVIGGLYAREQGQKDKVAEAITWQYRPANTDDQIPPSIEGQLLGLADRVQTIVAMFSIGNAPTGSKDPFALRRAANAAIKILAESNLPFDIPHLVGPLVGDRETLKHEVREFFKERLHFYLKDVRGFAYDVVSAVLAVGADDVRDSIARAEALTQVRGSQDFLAISAAFKRIKNILRQAEEKGYSLSSSKPVQLALETENLSRVSETLKPQVARLVQNRSYVESLTLIASLRTTVDAFFEKVMVLDSDPDVRGHNLALIGDVLDSFRGIADFSEIVTG